MNRVFRRIAALYALVIWMAAAAFCFPVHASAAGQPAFSAFSSFEELKQLCLQAFSTSGMTLISGKSIELAENLFIPAETTVIVSRITVPEGVTLTVMEDAELLTAALTVQGELLNSGTVIQQEMSLAAQEADVEIAAWIPGHITNRGTMILTNVYGRRNISSLTGRLVMNTLPSPTPDDENGKNQTISAPSASETPEPEPRLSGRKEFFQREATRPIRQTVLFSAPILLLILFVSIVLIKRGKAAETKKPADGQSAGAAVYSQDSFGRDQQNRIAELDDWLRNGLIDRKEYRILKKKYEQQSRRP